MIATLSGIDGSGKSSVARELCARLAADGYDAVLGKPDYVANEVVKDFCEAEFGDRYGYFRGVDADFYIACLTADWLRFRVNGLRRHHGRIVICDRYVHDVLAQAIHMGAHARELRRQIASFPEPDVSVRLMIDPEVAYRRLRMRSTQPIHDAEALPELTTLDAAYSAVEVETGWHPHKVDAQQPIHDLVDRIARLISARS